MSWFTKHRPTAVKELHLDSVRQTLTTLLTSPQFPQALLFAGPKGTGKTSSSRIIAALLNDPANVKVVDHLFFEAKKPAKIELKEPDSQNDLIQKIQLGTSLVVTEMDAASNRGIDDIRALKERLALPPQEGKVAVYILDEAHMLTTEAFNALLKVLEEPPAHVVFILATTELHKIPPTIVSRCFQIPFRKATTTELITALKSVVQKENLKGISDEILQLLANEADGSFRDGVKLLEQVAHTQTKLTLESVEQQLTGSSHHQIPQLVKAILAKDQATVIQIFKLLRKEGVSQNSFFKLVMTYLHDQLSKSLGVSEGEAIASPKIIHFLLKEISQVEYQQPTPIVLLPLEIKLLELIFRSQARQAGSGSSGNANKKPQASPVKKNDQTLSSTKLEVKPDTVPGNGQYLIDRWEEFLDQVKQKNSTIQALLRSAQPLAGEQGKAQIAVYYQFHQEQLRQPKFLSLLETCGQELAGGRVELDFVLSEQVSKPVTNQLEQEEQLVDLAKSILV